MEPKDHGVASRSLSVLVVVHSRLRLKSHAPRRTGRAVPCRAWVGPGPGRGRADLKHGPGLGRGREGNLAWDEAGNAAWQQKIGLRSTYFILFARNVELNTIRCCRYGVPVEKNCFEHIILVYVSHVRSM